MSSGDKQQCDEKQIGDENCQAQCRATMESRQGLTDDGGCSRKHSFLKLKVSPTVDWDLKAYILQELQEMQEVKYEGGKAVFR